MRMFALVLAFSTVPVVASADAPPEGPVYTTVVELPFSAPPADAPTVSGWKSIQVEGPIRAQEVHLALHIGEPILTWFILHKLCDANAPECETLAHVQILDQNPDDEASPQVVRLVFKSSTGDRVEVFNFITESGLEQNVEQHLAQRHYWTRFNDGTWSTMTDEKDRLVSYQMVRPLINLVNRLVQVGKMKVVKE